jgi:serine/threonine-protein kinase
MCAACLFDAAMVPDEDPHPGAAVLSPGSLVGPFEIVRLLGTGGMAVVYEAYEAALARVVALKILPPHLLHDETFAARFTREARVAASLEHPNIVPIYASGIHEGLPWMSMRLLMGGSLAGVLDSGPVGFDRAARILRDVAEALDYAHARGVIHRDVKPSNVLLDETDRACLSDFGLAHLAEAREPLSRSGTIAGTPSYMAPEQGQALPLDHRCDIYSLGIVAYEMLTGHVPFEGASPVAVLLQHARQPVPVPLTLVVPGPRFRVLAKALSKSPEARWASAVEFVTALEGVAEREDSTGTRSLAVLPLANLSGDRAQDFFADGMTDELISCLMRIEALRVASRTSVMAYRDAHKPLRQVGSELDVDWVVEGSVLQSGGRVRISVRLIESATERQFLAETYERDLSDVLYLQSEVAGDIAQRIRVHMTASERACIASRRQVDPHAYDAYLRARHFWNKRTRADLKRANDYFRSAIDKDPTWAPAYAGLADTYALLSTTGFDVMPPQDAMPRARAAALRALDIDDSMAQAHASLGYVLLSYEWDWDGAEEQFQRSIACNPAYPTAHQWYGHCLFSMGRLDDAAARMRRALELDPLSVPCNLGLGWSSYYARRYDDAIAQYRRTLEIAPDLPMVLYELGLAYQNKGCYDEALAAFERAHTVSGGEAIAVMLLGQLHGITGRHEEARRHLSNLQEVSRQQYVPALYKACIHAGVHDLDQAFAWFNQAYDERSNYLIYLGVEPTLDMLRSDIRYAELMRRVGLRSVSRTREGPYR